MVYGLDNRNRFTGKSYLPSTPTDYPAEEAEEPCARVRWDRYITVKEHADLINFDRLSNTWNTVLTDRKEHPIPRQRNSRIIWYV